jgi:SM-20-related protein
VINSSEVIVIDFDAISNSQLNREPFRFFATTNVLSALDLAAIRMDFPDIRKPGIFPLSALSYGSAFARLIDDIRSRKLQDIMAEKYDVDLSDKPLMITVRGHAQKKDGRIHTDTKTKIVTCLLYLNEIWDDGVGRLRMLRSPRDLDDYAAEIPPNGGTLASFQRYANSWHGHETFVGERRYVMFNWMASQDALDQELGRHRFSARLKQLNPFA